MPRSSRLQPIADLVTGSIYEVDDGLKERPDLKLTYARMRTPGIRDDGRAKVLAGTTSLEELLRVTREK